MRLTKTQALFVAFVAALAGCGSAPAPDTTTPEKSITKEPEKTAETPANTGVEVPPAIAEVIAAADRSNDDKALDAGRHPAEMLAFFGIGPGMKVADLAAGFGYTTELLARTVGPNGKVYGQNNKFVLEKFAEKGWTERLAKPVNKNVIRVNQEFDAPIPTDVHDLDAVIMPPGYGVQRLQRRDTTGDVVGPRPRENRRGHGVEPVVCQREASAEHRDPEQDGPDRSMRSPDGTGGDECSGRGESCPSHSTLHWQSPNPSGV